ncbi:MAG: hypothetical protein ACLQNE_24315 [Thermoguttaceae bacterium]
MRWNAGIVGFLFSFVLSAVFLADVVDLTPSQWGTILQVTGSAPSLQLSNGLGDIYVGRTNQDGQGPATISIRRGLVEFNVANYIPAGATITSVSMSMLDIRGAQWRSDHKPALRDSSLDTRHFLLPRRKWRPVHDWRRYLVL